MLLTPITNFMPGTATVLELNDASVMQNMVSFPVSRPRPAKVMIGRYWMMIVRAMDEDFGRQLWPR